MKRQFTYLCAAMFVGSISAHSQLRQSILNAEGPIWFLGSLL
ncbi:hypothetical protein OAL00_00090 [Verrucomicrobiales bacterium]|nr:hypothetical protein [Verrucomicrobiales bacterium]